MAASTLTIKDLHVEIEGKEILKGVNLEIKGGEFHAVMGPNGTGKSTLSAAIMGHPKYEVTKGSITLDGKDVLEMEVDERAQAGLFWLCSIRVKSAVLQMPIFSVQRSTRAEKKATRFL